MKEIIVNSKKHGTQTILVDDEDFEELNKYKWTIIKGNSTYYAYRIKSKIESGRGQRECISAHRTVMGCKFGDGTNVDHQDNNGLNCQKTNLRFCTYQENSRNRRSKQNSTSKYLGVSWDKKAKKWAACIKYNGESKRLGMHKTQELAAVSYNERASIVFGEFAKLNIID